MVSKSIITTAHIILPQFKAISTYLIRPEKDQTYFSTPHLVICSESRLWCQDYGILYVKDTKFWLALSPPGFDSSPGPFCVGFAYFVHARLGTPASSQPSKDMHLRLG